MTHLLDAATAGPDTGQGLRLRVDADLVDGAFSIHEGVLQPGEAVPEHVHETADQLIYVVEGSVNVTVGEETVEASSGDFVHKPKGVPHSLTNPTDGPTTVLEMTVTDQFQRFTEAASTLTDPAGMPALQAKYGMRFGG